MAEITARGNIPLLVGGTMLYYKDWGTGDPVVLQHGWPQNWWAWRHVIPVLAERYRVICPDLRGHGWSDAPPKGYEKEQFATDLLAVLDTLELEQAGDRLVPHLLRIAAPRAAG